MMKGYKVFNPDWTCRGFQYEVGKTYTDDRQPICCHRGFHFCKHVLYCFSYYMFDPANKVAEVEALGNLDTNDDEKYCTNEIKIIRELTWQEVLDLANIGKDCTGLGNTGSYNSGDCNTGDFNAGDYNSGNHNSGNWNSGNCNSGDWNKSSFNNGCFNTIETAIMMFNKPSYITYRDWVNSDARHLLNQIPKDVVEWIWSDDMTDEEKKQHPEHETTGGYLKVLDESECCQIWWNGLSDKEKEVIKEIPNFDPDKFYEITGIKVDR